MLVDKQLHEMIERLGDNNSNSNSNRVEAKICELDSNGVLVSRPVRSVQYLDSNVNPKPNSNQNEPIITELGGRSSTSKAGSSVSHQSNTNINKAKVITDFISAASRGRIF